MRRNFDRLRDYASRYTPTSATVSDRRVIMRMILGVLLIANLVALWLVWSPPGGSALELEAQAANLQTKASQKRAAVERTKTHASKVEKARTDETKFESEYFTDRRIASSTFVAELVKAAKDAGFKPKEHVFVFEPVEGSDSLSMMTITANYEGTYADLLQFINRLDRSSRFLILDSLTATPQQGGGLLNVTVKLNTFVREAMPAA